MCKTPKLADFLEAARSSFLTPASEISRNAVTPPIDVAPQVPDKSPGVRVFKPVNVEGYYPVTAYELRGLSVFVIYANAQEEPGINVTKDLLEHQVKLGILVEEKT